MKIHTPKTFRGRMSLAAMGAAAVLALSGVPANASTTNIDYDISGSTTTSGTGSNIALGPSVIHTYLEADGTFAADLTLPGTRTEFKLLGFIPVTANVNFEPVGQTTGVLTNATTHLESTSRFYVRLSNIKASIFPLFAGPHCRTTNPVVIDAATPAGETFNFVTGGNLTGTYSIGNFQNCGLNTLLINSLIPGSGNTIDLTLSNGRFAG